MSQYRFEETIAQHAQRLSVTQSWVNTRRRVLSGKLNGRAISLSGDDIPCAVQQMSTDDLMALLKVTCVYGHITTRGEEQIVLAPDEFAPDSLELQHAQTISAVKQVGLLQLGGNPRDAFDPPYGYMRNGEHIVHDPPASEAISTAFYLMDVYYAETEAIPWAQIARDLNDEGYCRKDGEAWTGDDVRELTRVPSYTGYLIHPKRGRPGDNSKVEKIENITPIISLTQFVRFARIGRGRKTDWLPILEAIVETIPSWERE